MRRASATGEKITEEELAGYDEEDIHEGEAKYHQLGWIRLTICLIVEAIALGSLTMPSVFATVGMVAGVLLTVGIGLTAIYTGYVVGQVKMKHPEVAHYADAVKLIVSASTGERVVWHL